MSAVCGACKFENTSGTRFCIQCGMTLQPAGANGDELAPNPNPEIAQAETEALLKRVAHEAGIECRETGAGYRVTISLGGDRKQRVHVTFNGRDEDGHDIISFLSVCGEFDPKHAENLLRVNNKMLFGAFAIRTIKGKDYYVVTANQLAHTADLDEIKKTLFEVARRADGVEERIGGGKDVF